MTADLDVTAPPTVASSAWHVSQRRVARHRFWALPWLAIVILAVFVAVGIFAPWLAPYDPEAQDLLHRLEAPSWSHPLGTDPLGRDLLSRLMYGSRVTLGLLMVALAIASAVGTLLGLMAAYLGGWVDAVISRTIDAILAFPTIFFGLLLAVTVGAGFRSVVLAVTLVVWARFARVIRAEVITLRERDFVAQAKISGCSRLRVICVHLLPNVLSPVMILVSINMGYVVLLESALSFLGAGIPPPTPTWGGIISDGQSYISTAWWVSVFPGLAIMFTILAFNLLGDWMRVRFDPQRRTQR